MTTRTLTVYSILHPGPVSHSQTDLIILLKAWLWNNYHHTCFKSGGLCSEDYGVLALHMKKEKHLISNNPYIFFHSEIHVH